MVHSVCSSDKISLVCILTYVADLISRQHFLDKNISRIRVNKKDACRRFLQQMCKPLKRQEKMHLLKSSAAYNCLTLLTN